MILAELGTYYRNYRRLMNHWEAVLPKDAFKTVVYEDLVADTEGVSRDMLDFCGLEWTDDVLEFHKSKRRVRTASVTQVRQPIYKTSMEKWRVYEDHLGPLIDAIGPDMLPDL